MKSLRPILLAALALMLFSMPSACPIPSFVKLAGYVQHPGVNFTNAELQELNLSDIKDTSNQAIPDKKIYSFFVKYSRVGDLKRTSVGGSYNGIQEGFKIQEVYKNMMDTVLSQLNIGDSLFVRYYLNNDSKQTETNEGQFFYSFFDRFLLEKTYVISSQAVVDLKRSPEGAGMVAYPSPASTEVSVKFEVKEVIGGHITLINTLGQIITEVDHENLMLPYTFRIDDEPAGTYYIRAQVDGEFFIKKFVKE